MDISSYARVAVNVPAISREFDYLIPEEFQGKISAGSLVEVPFNNRLLQGVVTRLVNIPEVVDVKPIISLVDPFPVLTARQLQLAGFLSETTMAPLCQCIDLMIPPGLSSQADTLVELIDGNESLDGLGQTEVRLMKQLIERGNLRLRQLEAAIPHVPLQGSIRKLQQAGKIKTRSILLPPRVKPKLIRTASLAHPIDSISNLKLAGQKAEKTHLRRQMALEFLSNEALPVDVTWIYAASGCTLADLVALQEMNLIVLHETEIWRDPLKNVIPLDQANPVLTSDQKTAWETISHTLQQVNTGVKTRPMLLQGITGSGKTELYMRAVEDTIMARRQAIVLVPEISLTPLAVQRFLSRFPGQVGLIHSRLSPGERYDTWRRARAGMLPVIIGPRSALFTPLENIGLIVIDECHDDSYYQSDVLPMYSTQQAALKYAEICQCALLLGSATPDVTQLYEVHRGVWQHLILPRRVGVYGNKTFLTSARGGGIQSEQSGFPSDDAGQSGLPHVEIVDMREELKAGTRSMFSRPLQEGLQKVLEAGEQAILFLNRRGTATYVFCFDCGHSLRCLRCEIPLTLHTTQDGLVCHHCGYKRQMPKSCPNCGSSRIKAFGTGTERVEAELKNLFPTARILRWDSESTQGKDSHEIILDHFTAHHADFLIGTQMVSKGHDFPLVTLVGILLAETGLNLPDYRAPERTFQLITQVAGRAGRGERGGRVLLQTYMPQHYAIQAASRHDLNAFYEVDIKERYRLQYPPFIRLARLLFQDMREKNCQEQAEKIRAAIAHKIEIENMGASSVGGALPCFFSRQGGYYRYQVLLRSPDPVRVLEGIPLENCRVQIDPPDLL